MLRSHYNDLDPEFKEAVAAEYLSGTSGRRLQIGTGITHWIFARILEDFEIQRRNECKFAKGRTYTQIMGSIEAATALTEYNRRKWSGKNNPGHARKGLTLREAWGEKAYHRSYRKKKAYMLAHPEISAKALRAAHTSPRNHSTEWRRKVSLANRGRPVTWVKNHTTFFSERLGHTVRSTYEETYLLRLKRQGISYEYESVSFKFTNHDVGNWTPDALVHFPDGDCYVEIKNDWNVNWPTFQKKLKAFRAEYPHLKVRVVVSHDGKEFYDWNL